MSRVATSSKIARLPVCALFGVGILCVVTALPASAARLIHLHDFDACPDGGAPGAALIQAPDGNLYGTTTGLINQPANFGTVFKMTTGGVITTLHRFDGFDGQTPGPLILGSDGAIYGSCISGGAGFNSNRPSGNGTLFKVTSTGIFTLIHAFQGGDGTGASVSMLAGSDGVIYGASRYGGIGWQQPYQGNGTLFSIDISGRFRLLHVFSGPDGVYPQGDLVLANDGNVYGTTAGGGSSWTADRGNGTFYVVRPGGTSSTIRSFPIDEGNPGYLQKGVDGNLYCFGAGGNLFRITYNGALTVLLSNSSLEVEGFVQGNDGNFYLFGYSGVYELSAAGSLTRLSGQITSLSGLTKAGDGSIYAASSTGYLRVVPGVGVSTVNYTDAGPFGSNPGGALVQGSDGNLYGVMSYGGILYGPAYDQFGLGTVVRVNANSMTTTYRFAMAPNDGQPPTAVAAAADGSTYGGTLFGGQTGLGTLFRCDPNSIYSTIHTFSASEGSYPTSMLVGHDGNVYGTVAGGSFKCTPGGAYTTFIGHGPLITNGLDGLYGVTGFQVDPDQQSIDSYGSIFSIMSNEGVTGFSGFSQNCANPVNVVQTADGNLWGISTPTQYTPPATTDNPNPTPLIDAPGTIFKVTPAGLSVIYSGIDATGLALGSDGLIYGTTVDGKFFRVGLDGTFSNLGSVPPSLLFLVAGAGDVFYGLVSPQLPATGPSAVGSIQANGAYSTIYSFTDWSTPSMIVEGADGNLDGIAQYGGLFGGGMLYKILVNDPAPGDLAAMAGDRQVKLTWSPIAGASGYNVYEGTAHGAEGATAIAAHVAATTFTVTGLTDNQTYYFVITSLTSVGESADSNEVQATPEPPVPATPTGLQAVAGVDQVALTWKPSPGATSYNIYLNLAAPSNLYVSGYVGTSISIPLQTGEIWYLAVSASNDGGTSALSASVTAAPMPSAPSLEGWVGNASVMLQWSHSQGITSYNLYRGTAAGEESPTPLVTVGTETGYLDTGVSNGTTYYYKVAAVDVGGTSALSNEVVMTPPLPANHNTLVLQNDTTNQVEIWTITGATVTAVNTVSHIPYATWRVVGVFDFDRDGHPDLLFRNEYTGDLAIWFMNGPTLIGAQFLGNEGPNSAVVGMGYLAGAGNPYMVFFNAGVLEAMVLDPQGSNSVPVKLFPKSGWQPVAVGELNPGGSQAGILFQNLSTRQLQVGYSIGGQITKYVSISQTPSAGWTVVAIDNLTSNAEANIIFQNSNRLVEWTLNNGTVVSGTYINATVPAGWSVVGPK